eukprot:TRINITY_DN31002_c0_g1_i1.p1 TRINITY_DN31002_c0_g1~~TRINITY_DN31002_c0_g1_i1.p1  ORF type:complete len:518 (+),score=102.58 TRINITY_DN31002_c0_g1_i1:171-1724(+)
MDLLSKVLVAVALLSATSTARVVIPLQRHERDLNVAKGASFLSLASGLEAKLAKHRARHNNTHAIEYYGQITVGGQAFSVIFDSGSDQLAVPGTRCVSSACKSHRTYDSSTSKTAEKSPEDASTARQLAYGTGNLMGYQHEDQVCLGDACGNAKFVEALQESDEAFLNAKFDGVLGLSLKLRSNTTAKDSVLSALVASKAIDKPMFSVFMSKDLHSESSEITFGSSEDASKMASAPMWVNLSDPGFWQFSLEGVSVGKEDLKLCKPAKEAFVANTTLQTFFGKMCCRSTDEFANEDRCQYQSNFSGWRSGTMSKGVVLQTYEDGRLGVKMDDGCVQKVPLAWVALENGCRGDGTIQAILDTGSSLMMAPSSMVDGISKAVGVKEDCTEQDMRFPPLTLRLPGGKELTLKSDDYMDTIYVKDEKTGADKTYCWLHLLSNPKNVDAKGPLFVLGLPFLRAYYTTFDAEKHRVGFAMPKQPSSSSSQAASVTNLKEAPVTKRGAGVVSLHARRPGETPGD